MLPHRHQSQLNHQSVSPFREFSNAFPPIHSANNDRCANLLKLCTTQKAVVLLAKDKTDEHLMEAYRDGDLKAFDELFTRFKDILFRYLARQTGNMSSAEELFQDIWAALIKNRKAYTVKAKFKTYLFHIAHNKLIDYYRSKKNSTSDMLSYDEQENDNYIVDDNQQSLEHQADVLNKYKQLLALLDKLPAAQRDVFLMHEEAGMTLIEIADVMNVSRDTVKSRLRYALQRLRNGMRHYA